MKYRVGLGLLLQFCVSVLYAQEALKGVVLSEDAKGKLEPIPFANVYWQGTNYGTSTDTNGVFQLAIPEGAKNLITSFVGYQTDTTFVEDFDHTISVSLKQSVELKTVDIEYRKRSSEMSFINPIQTLNMDEKELFKAACCNLSESFETNPSVDVNFTDAVTGAKQIRMLGLNGPYTMISRENMPGIRGLGNSFGLSFVPGTWIGSIQVTKGVGTVVNGFESIAGQINVELQKPDDGEQTFVNAFGNAAGRVELNLIHTEQLSEHVGTTILLHGNNRSFEKDNNKDGFMDFPLQDEINFANRWKFKNDNGWMGQLGISFLKSNKEGGQTEELTDAEKLKDANFNPYLVEIETERVELYGKTGYVFPKFKYKSTAILWSLNNFEQSSLFGNRKYDARQRSAYANWIYQSIIVNTMHQFKTGLSFAYDEYEETLDSNSFDRVERVPGSFFEYTFKPNNNITLVAGVRADYHNLYGAFVTPRLHFRYAVDENTVVRFLGGSGQRSPTILSDKQSLMASSRSFDFMGSKSGVPYGLEMEKAWNFGFNVSRSFKLDYRDGSVNLDVYRTEFENQVVVDLDESAQRVLFYNLQGKSFSNTAQLQIDYELIKFLDVRLAYRWVQVETEFKSGLRQQPLTPEHRFFINLAYETQSSLKDANWTFDLTMQWIDKQRIPTTAKNLPENIRATESPSFVLFNTQVTRNFSKRFAVYMGMENILDYRQDDPIIAADNPFGNNFDASLVWGPIFGRNIYGGLRYRIQKEEK